MLGHGTNENEISPKLIESLKDKRVTHAAISFYHTIFVVEGNFIFLPETINKPLPR